ncbi:MAG TPA: hypothetical protein ENK23_02685, partial [Sorangium sp.]|nr:hypothetical protein [Sorangium sp.]
MLTQRNCYVIGHTTKCGAADLSLPDGQRLATNTYVLCQPFNCVRFVRPTSTPLADDKDPLWKARRGRGDFRAPLLATPLLWLVIFAVLLGSGPAAAQTPANASPGGEAAPLPPPDEGSTPSSPSHSAAPPTTAVMSTRRPRHDTILSYYLDLDIDGGLSWEISGDRAVGLGRVRVGLLTMMQVRNRPAESPILMSLGATYGLSVFSPAEVGVEMEITHLKTGFWGQA